MSKITLDESLRAKLNGLNEELEVCDDSGQTIGHFLPAAAYRRMMYRIAELQCPYTPEELAKAREQTGGRTLEEWKRITGLFQ